MVEVIGFSAAAIGALAFLPQVLKTWRTRSSQDLSWGMLASLIAATTLWVWYGLHIGSSPIVAGNATTLTFASTLTFLKWRNER